MARKRSRSRSLARRKHYRVSTRRYKKRNPNSSTDLIIAGVGAAAVVGGLLLKGKSESDNAKAGKEAKDTGMGTYLVYGGFGVLALGTILYFSKKK